MNNVKPWYASSGVWGGVVSIGAGVAALLGTDVPPDLQGQIVSKLIIAGSLVGGAVSLVGRVKARFVIGKPLATGGLLAEAVGVEPEKSWPRNVPPVPSSHPVAKEGELSRSMTLFEVGEEEVDIMVMLKALREEVRSMAKAKVLPASPLPVEKSSAPESAEQKA